MATEIRSYIEGAFTGYNGGAIFKLVNGQVWQQKHYRYQYRYAYRPEVRIYQHSSNVWMMQVAVMDEPIEIVRANVIEDGPIVSDFNGFSGDSRFAFQSGRVWEQAEYKYSYHYAHRPSAVVVDGINGYELHVDGMDETVRVRRTG